MTMASQEDLYKAQEKLEVVELAYSLHSIILEVRRYEKNFLLYGTTEALNENHKQLDLALETVENIKTQVSRFKAYPLLVELKKQILSYQGAMKAFSTEFVRISESGQRVFPGNARYPGDAVENLPKNGEMVDNLRFEGQEMTVTSEELVSFEHLQIRSILNQLIEQLLVWSLVAITIGIFMPLIMSLKIFKPLRVIKAATEDIARGRFSKIEVLNTRDEMQQVMEAFNTMVHELELRQNQLVQSQKLSSIGTLTAGIAHQLNNPLNNISTSCQIALDDFDAGDQAMIRKMLGNIDQETCRARDVVQGLLEFSRTRDFEVAPVNLLEVVKRSLSLVKSQVPANVVLTVDISEHLVLPMDAQRVQEVLLNMIINAVQAISGEGQVAISAWENRDGNEAIIEIRDSGEGIPEEIQDRLFDPFYTTKEEGKGTGLGLSIAYGIIEKHRGRITVESSPGHGASFSIHLPLTSTPENV